MAPGKYSVGIPTELCIACMLCSEMASDNLCADPETGIPYVCRQPETTDEENLFREAMDLCPTGAISDDGVNRTRRGL